MNDCPCEDIHQHLLAPVYACLSDTDAETEADMNVFFTGSFQMHSSHFWGAC